MLDMLKFSISADARVQRAFGQIQRELSDVRGALAGVAERAERTGRSIRNMGLGLSAGVTAPLGLLGKDMVELYNTQAKAEAAVTQAVESTGQAAGKAAEELFRMASGLQEASTFGDEDILQNVTAPLLTFTQVSGEAFDRAQQAVLDMSTLLGKDLSSSALQVGKALNDPVRGLNSLQRAGVQFSDEQKEVIKALVETGDVAAAQGLILDELERQFGGQAAAAAEAGLGPLEQLSNAIGDVKEQFGEQIVTFLPDLIKEAEKLVGWFAELSPEVKKNVVVFGGLAAAAGPVLAFLGAGALGIVALTKAFVALGVAAMANPIVAVIALIAAGALLIYRNWDGIRAFFGRLFGGIATWAQEAWAKVKNWAQEAWAKVKAKAQDAWEHLEGLWEGLGDWFRDLGPDLKAAFGDLWGSIKAEVASWPGRMLQYGKDMISNLISGLNSEQIPVIDPLANARAVGSDAALGVAAGVADGAPAVNDAMRGLGAGAEDEIRDFLQSDSPSRLFMRVGADMAAGLAIGAERGAEAIPAGMRVAIVNAGSEAVDAAGDLRRDMETAMRPDLTFANVNSPLTGARGGLLSMGDAEDAGRRAASGLASGVRAGGGDMRRAGEAVGLQAGEGVQAGMATGIEENGAAVMAEMQGIADGLIQTADIGQQLGQQFGQTFSAIVRGAEDARSAIARLLDTMADQLLTQVGQRIFGNIFGGLGSAVTASADGNAFARGNVIPFASGGVVDRATFFPMAGRRTGLMGEAGPEAILPLSRAANGQLGVVASGGSQQVDIVLHVPEGVTAQQVAGIARGVSVQVVQSAGRAQRRGMAGTLDDVQARGA